VRLFRSANKMIPFRRTIVNKFFYFFHGLRKIRWNWPNIPMTSHVRKRKSRALTLLFSLVFVLVIDNHLDPGGMPLR
jgi:hypothetical protein